MEDEGHPEASAGIHLLAKSVFGSLKGALCFIRWRMTQANVRRIADDGLDREGLDC
jgi:hypothetical protein